MARIYSDLVGISAFFVALASRFVFVATVSIESAISREALFVQCTCLAVQLFTLRCFGVEGQSTIATRGIALISWLTVYQIAIFSRSTLAVFACALSILTLLTG
jgi:hypothetical protein